MASPVAIPPVLTFPDTLTPYRYFCQRVLPSVYGDEISYYEVLCKVTDYLNKTMSNVNDLNEDAKKLYVYVEELYALLEKFMTSGFDDYYAEQAVKWIDTHLTWIFNHVAKQVYFGLTMDGHFVAYIPESWSDITFDTGAVYGRTDYGRLILRFDADGAINNTYSYSLAQPTKVDKLVADLEVTARRGDASFDTLFTNLDQEVNVNANL